ncbi:hypothetical protein H2198_004221 [Neophaeococcomyces mojaviensis]|uniref:Uncharacterized protein n=1 Tax=Neophaeococcomyces mojaviensis TaxID=3383035 RepID=A0ACC3A9K3_9EURO|nr:hypothetical protein H2198_004221 [Knufia sp. JES_112]
MEDQSFLETLCNLEIPVTVRFSPDQRRVLFSTQLTWGHKKGSHAVSTIWLATTNVQRSAQRIICGTFNDYAPAWNPNGNSIAFISDRAQVGRNWALYMLALHDEAQPVLLTPPDNQSPITAFAFSPDGHSIASITLDEKSTEEKWAADNNNEDARVWGKAWSYARL